MATRRMVPTNFFKHPDILNLGKREHRQVLLCLLLLADDEGRGVANTALLVREMGDYHHDEIEEALQSLRDNDLLMLYQVGKHRYYSLTQWNEWQTINKNRMVHSKYPAPPPQEQAPAGEVQEVAEHLPACAEKIPAVAEHLPAQFNVIESNVIEEEGSNTHPSNVVPFPTTHGGDGDYEKQVTEMTGKLAPILKLPVTADLTQLVRDFLDDHTLSLLGEAYAAREYLDDPQRNHKRKKMSAAFFRNWLKREQGSHAAPRAAPHPGQSTYGSVGPPTSPQAPAAPRNRSLMGLAEEYARESRQQREPNQRQREGPPPVGASG